MVDNVLRVDAVLDAEQQRLRIDDRSMATAGCRGDDCWRLSAVVVESFVVVVAVAKDAELIEVVDKVVTAGLLVLLTTRSDTALDSAPCTPLRSRYDSWPLGDATRLNLSESGA